MAAPTSPSLPGFAGSRWRRAAPWLFAGVALALLLTLAWLQQRWLAQVSQAERERTRTAIRNAADAFAGDFNDQLARLAFDLMAPTPAERSPAADPQPPANAGAEAEVDPALEHVLAARVVRWRRAGREPALLRRALVVELRPAQEPRLLALDEGAPGRLHEIAWPAELAAIGQRLADRGAAGRRGGVDPLAADVPALVLPFLPFELAVEPPLPPLAAPAPPAPPTPPAPPPPPALPVAPAAPAARPVEIRPLGGDDVVFRLRAPAPAAESHDTAPPRGARPGEATPLWAAGIPGGPAIRHRRLPWTAPIGGEPGFERRAFLLILELDRDFLVGRYLPALAERHFPGHDFDLAVRADPRAPVSEAVFAWPGAPRPGAVVEAEAPLFGPLLPARPDEGDDVLVPARWRGFFGGFLLDEARGGNTGRWRLQVYHPAGSLEAAVERTRRRNLALVFGILGVLALALAALAWAARRAEMLAARQLELMAGITHELWTPLAALRSAGQNLRDGVVKEPAKVARYGELIVAEGGRLSELVGQVLTFAGMAGQGQTFHPERLDPAAVLAEVVGELRPTLETAGLEVAVDAPAGLPAVYADAAALRRALGNLLANAVKYGRPAEGDAPIELCARATDQGRALAFEVRDHGPGIADHDRPHLFEPFYRGKAVVASALPGAGLGLALVKRLAEAMGGRVELTTTPGRGASFVLTLPAAAEESP